MILYLGSAQMFSNVVRIISGLLVAGFVLPEVLGTFNGIGIVMGYLPILQLGIMNGLNRDLPYYFGKGEFDKAKKYASVAQFWELSLSVLVFSILIFLSVFYFFKGNLLFAAGFFSYALASIHHYYGMNYLQVLFRTNQDFNRLSSITLIISVISLASVLFVWKWKFYGLCLRSTVTLLVEVFLLWKWKPLSVKPKFDFAILKEINKVGLPIFIVGIIFSLWSTIQNTFVLKLGGVEQFGLFQLALMIETSLGVVVFSVSQVVYPKMSFEYGKGKGIKDLLQVSFKPILFIFLFLIPSILIAWIFLPYAVNWLLPKYVNGVGAAQWTMLLLFISIWAVNNNIFNVIKKQGDFLISIIAGMLVYTAALLILHHYEGFSLKHFPQAMFIGKCSQLLIGYFFIWRYLNSK